MNNEKSCMAAEVPTPELIKFQLLFDMEVSEIYNLKNEIQRAIYSIADVANPTDEPLLNGTSMAEPRNFLERANYSLTTLRRIRYDFLSINEQLNKIIG